jgi:hypothetical protein
MGYPETFEGYMISDQSKWTEFQKKEVRSDSILFAQPPITNPYHSSSRRSLRTVILTLRLNAAAFAAQMSIPSQADGETALFQFALATRSSAKPLRSATR